MKNLFGKEQKQQKKKFFISTMVKKYKREKISKMENRYIFFKKKIFKFNFVKNGGWHFTCLRTPEELEKKLLNFAHHYEFEESGLKIDDLKKLIAEKRVMYDHNVDQKGYKNGQVNQF